MGRQLAWSRGSYSYELSTISILKELCTDVCLESHLIVSIRAHDISLDMAQRCIESIVGILEATVDISARLHAFVHLVMRGSACSGSDPGR